MTVDEFVSKYKASPKIFCGCSLGPVQHTESFEAGLDILDTYLELYEVDFHLTQLKEKFGRICLYYMLPENDDHRVSMMVQVLVEELIESISPPRYSDLKLSR